MNLEEHFIHSSYRERLIEHLFVGELLKHSWLGGRYGLEVAKPEVDNSGYDLIAEDNGVIRHLQLKASSREAKTVKQNVHTALGTKPSGVVVWVQFDAATLELGPYLIFGGSPGQPLPDLSGLKVAKHTKGNAEGIKAERPAIRVVPKSRFNKYESAEEVYKTLFGTL